MRQLRRQRDRTRGHWRRDRYRRIGGIYGKCPYFFSLANSAYALCSCGESHDEIWEVSLVFLWRAGLVEYMGSVPIFSKEIMTVIGGPAQGIGDGGKIAAGIVTVGDTSRSCGNI